MAGNTPLRQKRTALFSQFNAAHAAAKEYCQAGLRTVKRYHISPQAVILEITEEQAFSNAESSMYNIEQLHKFGFRIAIDDFGTGYANYNG